MKLETDGENQIILNFKFLVSNYRSLFISTLLFLTAATISVFTSINTRAALGEWKAFYVEPIILFLILTTDYRRQAADIAVDRRPSIVDHILFGLLACGLVTSLLSIYQHFTGWNVPHAFWANRNTFRVTGWYGFPNAVGLFLAPLIPLAMYLVKQSWAAIGQRRYGDTGDKDISLIAYRLSFIISLILIPCALLATYYAKSTGGLIGIAAGIGVLLIYNKKTRLAACLVGLVGIVGLVSLPSTNPIRQEILAQDRSGQIRVEMWGETVQYLSEHPLTGAGLASYTTVIAPYRINKHIEIFHHPHNIFLTMWVNLGILGLVGFVWILVWFFWNAKYRIQNEEYDIVPFLVASMATLLTTGLVDSPYIKNDLSIFFWTLIALLVILRREKNSAF